MALKIRMARRGTTNRPYYHIVAADSRSPRDGAYLEKLGTYNPLAKEGEQKVNLVTERVQFFLNNGAQPTDRIAKFLADAGLIKARKLTDKPVKSAPKKRSQERAADKAEKEAALKEAANAPKEEAPVAAAEEAPASDTTTEEAAA